jgi:hypothetical protein
MRLRYFVPILGIALGTSLAIAPGAQAAVTVNISVPIDTLQPTVSIPCTGDTIALTGDLHILMAFTINGNHVWGKEQFQPQGVSGTDLTTGAAYRGTGVTQDDFSASLINGQFQATSVNNFRIIGEGSASSYLVHENTHITINANGTVTANIDNLNISCG